MIVSRSLDEFADCLIRHILTNSGGFNDRIPGGISDWKIKDSEELIGEERYQQMMKAVKEQLKTWTIPKNW